MIQRHVWVSGRVQGVYFRQSTAEEARKRPGVNGFVRNLEDGRVEALFCGKQEDVLALVAWCRKGPPAAEVTGLEVADEPVDASWQASGFHIRH